MAIPETLFRAMLAGDVKTILKFGKQGMEVLKRLREKEMKRLLIGSKEMMLQANEDICPVD